jgi:hypothetical protein
MATVTIFLRNTHGIQTNLDLHTLLIPVFSKLEAVIAVAI